MTHLHTQQTQQQMLQMQQLQEIEMKKLQLQLAEIQDEQALAVQKLIRDGKKVPLCMYLFMCVYMFIFVDK